MARLRFSRRLRYGRFWFCCADVQTIGPEGSSVGFAAVNGAFHNLTGVHWTLYHHRLAGAGSDRHGAGLCRAGAGAAHTEKALRKVDRSILALGGFYLAVMAFYVLFEKAGRQLPPGADRGVLEASYPSSTTMLAVHPLFSLGISRSDGLFHGHDKRPPRVGRARFCFAAGLLELQKVAAVDIRSVFQLNGERFGVTQSQRGDIVEQRALRGNSCIIDTAARPMAPARQGVMVPSFPMLQIRCASGEK